MFSGKPSSELVQRFNLTVFYDSQLPTMFHLVWDNASHNVVKEFQISLDYLASRSKSMEAYMHHLTKLYRNSNRNLTKDLNVNEKEII